MLIWQAKELLDPETHEVIEMGADAVLVSAASIWEIEIKRALHKLEAPNDLAGLVDESGFERLDISYEHAREAGRLHPFRGDPFDRMLIAQTRLEGLTLATADLEIKRYDVPVFDVVLA